ncbi:ACP S-malonyltransferase [Paenibacillus melissococcoides]|uniref:[acyl-carrier-protein] S-malonyltransferase n=2 Tax=Paenibacillus TaxID=44249 RepID=A0ABN8TXJ9_9BACL|nr:ACP S-malonyltransferase [Paenibacillus melissococcoides]CAH8704371.1 ACP S-malonyltransferase [Paenibacillus melissococcoides]CAH8707640.1 ACP S-malonyltransferase [Paenibacillus melissococcoides]
MGKELYKRSNLVRSIYEEASETVGYNLAQVSFEDDGNRLNRTEFAQPALLTLSYSMFRVYMDEIGEEPCYMAGHSLGEYSALACSGAISFANAVRLASQRGQIMQNAVPPGAGAMSAVRGLSYREVLHICNTSSVEDARSPDIACFNSPMQFVVSGEAKAVRQVEHRVEHAGGLCTRLKVSGAFHSYMMNQAAVELQHVIKQYLFHDLRYPVVSNVTSKPYRSTADIVPALTKQMTSTVRWYETMVFLHAQGVRHYVELGPGRVLEQLAKQAFKRSSVLGIDSMDKKGNWRKADDMPVTVQHICARIVDGCLAVAASAENRNEDEHEFEHTIHPAYKELKRIKESLVALGEMAKPIMHASTAIERAEVILTAKKLDKLEVEARLSPLQKLFSQLQKG